MTASRSTSLASLALVAIAAAQPAGAREARHRFVIGPPMHHAHHHHGTRVLRGVAGRWYRGDGPVPARSRSVATPYGGAPRVEDTDYGHLSTQATSGGPYRSEVPLPLTRAEPALAPSPYIGR